jgi:hypothetical protein
MKRSIKPGDLVRLISEPRSSRLERLMGQPSIVTSIQGDQTPPRVIIAVFDPTKRDIERIRCREDDLELIHSTSVHA